MIETVKRPYELLVRWRDGVMSGAHVGFEVTTTEDGVALSTTPLPVVAVDIGQGVGFPLADILDTIHADALVACAAHETTIAELRAELSAAQQVHADALAVCSAHEATIAAHEATIDELRAAP